MSNKSVYLLFLYETTLVYSTEKDKYLTSHKIIFIESINWSKLLNNK